jgi:hypothetical protein
MTIQKDSLSLPILWTSIQRKMHDGRELKDGAYRVVTCSDKKLTLERVATGSTVNISRKMVEKTWARLDAGEIIPRRGINYTVAIETGVVIALGRSITDAQTVGGIAGYRKA